MDREFEEPGQVFSWWRGVLGGLVVACCCIALLAYIFSIEYRISSRWNLVYALIGYATAFSGNRLPEVRTSLAKRLVAPLKSAWTNHGAAVFAGLLLIASVAATVAVQEELTFRRDGITFPQTAESMLELPDMQNPELWYGCMAEEIVYLNANELERLVSPLITNYSAAPKQKDYDAEVWQQAVERWEAKSAEEQLEYKRELAVGVLDLAGNTRASWIWSGITSRFSGAQLISIIGPVILACFFAASSGEKREEEKESEPDDVLA